MTCNEASDFIGPYLEDELPDEGRRRIESHLLVCRDCCYEAESLRITRRRLREERSETIASDAFRARGLSRLRADNPHIAASDESETLTYQIPMPF